MIISRSIHTAISSILFFFLMAKLNSIVYACVCVYTCIPHVFIHSLVSDHFDCFQVLAVVNDHWDAWILLDHVFFHIYAQGWDCWIIW